MPAKDVVIRGAGVVVIAGALIGGGAYTVGTVLTPGSAGSGASGSGAGVDSGVTANLYAVASGGSPNCTRSSSRISYSAAVSAGAVCGPGVRTSNSSIDGTGFGNSCHAATAGDQVGVKNGAYAQNPANGYIVDGNLDCSDGSGADYDPNAVEKGGSLASLTNWVKFLPADTTPAITFTVGSMTIPQGNYHMIWENIDVNTGIRFNSGGESAGQQAKNIIMRGSSASNLMTIYGIQIIGSKNILLKNISNGPSNQCAKNDPNVPVAWRCNPSGPWFEAQYANVGTATAGCDMIGGGHLLCGGWWANNGSEWAELYIHDGGAGGYENIRLENFINHDQQSKQDSTAAAHPGCLMHFGGSNIVQTSHNAVLDHYVCERAAGAAIQFADSGWTVQNSVFGCQVASLQNTGGAWDGSCVGVPFGFGIKESTGGTGATNVLIRYNYFGGTTTGLLIQTSAGFVNNFSNIRIVGNVFAGTLTCGVTGVTYNSNAFVSGISTCGTNAQGLAAGDPVVTSSYANGGTYSLKNPVMNPHADGSPAYTALNPSTLGTDFQLGWDMDGDVRSSTSTKPGADG